MQRIIDQALAKKRDVLLEHELLAAFGALGLPMPACCFMTREAALKPGASLGSFEPKRAVLKVVSPQILHKSDMGGVVFLEHVTEETVVRAVKKMLEAIPSELHESIEGFLLEAAIPFEAKLGHELLIGMRHSPDFGPVYTIGFGGTYVEDLAAATQANQATVLYRPGLTSREQLQAKLSKALFFRWATGGVRGVSGVLDAKQLSAEISRWIDGMEQIRQAVERSAAGSPDQEHAGRGVLEFELNPLVFSEGRLVPVDALMRLGALPEVPPPFVVESLRAGLLPKSVAVIGVSTKMNMGRIILRSIIDGGFDQKRLYVVREGVDTLDGVPCVVDVASLPESVDLLVLAVPASAVPGVLGQVFEHKKAKTVLLIPGGMGETEGGKGIAAEVDALLKTYADDPGRPVLVGNNSVGLVSRPAAFDSLFIPKQKLPRTNQGLSNMAFITQSGAFMLTQLGKLDVLSPDFQLSVGNQLDARISHFAEALAHRQDISTFAFYVEGLKEGDGKALAEAVARLREAGKDAIIYKAGRSVLGQAATMGHTASVAGDHRVFDELLTDAGALVVDRFSDFLDSVRLSVMLPKKRVDGLRTAFISNAGYETVGMADAFEGQGYALKAAALGSAQERIATALKNARIAALVNVANPLDLTPMANDEVHGACIEALLADPGVDLGVFGCVPYTPAMQTLPQGLSDGDVFDAPEGYANRVIALGQESDKPFVVVIDAGRHYDPLCDYLEAGGVPCFRDADRAVAALGRYAQGRLRTVTP